ncbi:hypothetical protein AB2B38_006640 [Balneola sp. MJW-20]|uniref:hypothetical protein n=1 Tax=Gracilimonas aurantiaca TaxID=3234185 RepID=UPI0034670188
MNYYFDSLVRKLNGLGLELSGDTQFTEKPWVAITKFGVTGKFIFREDGIMLISIKGKLETAGWEHIEESKSLIITMHGARTLYQYRVLDEAVVVLRIDRSDKVSDYTVLVNDLEVPDLKVYDYIKKKLLEEKHIQLVELQDGREVHIKHRDKFHRLVGSEVTLRGNKLRDGVYVDKDRTTQFQVESGIIKNRYRKKDYENGVSVWQSGNYPRVGERVEGIEEGVVEAKDELDSYLFKASVSSGKVSGVKKRYSSGIVAIAVTVAVTIIVSAYFAISALL